jgi:hypothetical protein
MAVLSIESAIPNSVELKRQLIEVSGDFADNFSFGVADQPGDS